MAFKIGLALGGGGVRGFAHFGVLKVLIKEGIPLDVISGTSFGSIVGSRFCLDGNLEQSQKELLHLVRQKKVQELEIFIGATNPVEEKKVIVENLANFVKDLCLWNLKTLRRWLVDPRPFRDLIFSLVANHKFADCKIPFVSVAADLYNGEEVDLKEGELLPAVLASISLAGIFPPYKIGDRNLIDGGALSIVPVEAAKGIGADFVIGINVEGNLLFNEVHNGLDALFQAYEISSYELNRVKLRTCDFVIAPPIQEIKWAQFSQAEYCIKKGEEAAAKVIDDLKKQLAQAQRGRSIFSFLGFNKPKKKDNA